MRTQSGFADTNVRGSQNKINKSSRAYTLDDNDRSGDESRMSESKLLNNSNESAQKNKMSHVEIIEEECTTTSHISDIIPETETMRD